MASRVRAWLRTAAARMTETGWRGPGMLLPVASAAAPGATVTSHPPGQLSHGPDLDNHTPAPNDGPPARNDAARKKWYASERIQLPPNWREVGPAPWFRADRRTLTGQPGFHIIGICPSCRHKTVSVCATEYLANDVAGEAGAVRQRAAAAPAAARPPAAAAPAGQAALEHAALEHAALEHAGEAIAAPHLDVAELPDDSMAETEYARRGKKWLQAEHRPAPQRAQTSGGPKTQVTVLRCACVENHVPAAPGAFGCGSEWLLQVEYDDSTQPGKTYISVVDPEAVYRYWPAADAAAAEVPAALTTAQSAAKNWAGALTAILGLIGIGTLLGSRTVIQDFSLPSKILFGVLAFIAVLADAAMLYQSDLAAFGRPKIRAALKPSDQWNADLDPLTQASASVRKLRRSVWAAAISAVAALGAVGILLFTPPAPTSSRAKVVYVVNGTKTTTACGWVTFPPASATGQPASFVTFTPSVTNGPPESINLTTIAEIDPC